MSTSQIAAVVWRARERRQMSIEQLAERTQIALDRLLAFHRGECPLSTAKLQRVADALRLEQQALLRGEDREATEPTLYFRQFGTFDFREEDRPVLARSLERARALSAVHAILGRTSRIRAALRPEPVGAVPYQDGYRAATELRRLLDNRTQPILDIGAIFGEELDTLVEVVRLQTQRVEAVTVKDLRDDAALVVLNASRCDPRRFPLGGRVTLAHELAHLLLDEGEEASIYLHADLARTDDLPPSTRDVSPVEQRANAFHAEFLMPLAGLRALLGPPGQVFSPAQADALVDMARVTFLTPVPLTVFHLVNHKFIARDEELLQDLMQAAAQRPAPAIPPECGVARVDVLRARVSEAHERLLITDGRARELLALSPWDELPWEREAR